MLIVDLANLVVRSYHVGQPSEVHAVRGMLDTVAGLIETYHPELLLFAAEGGHDVRCQLYPDYKAHRKPTEQNLKDQLILAAATCEGIGWPVLKSSGYEADDVIATLARYCGPRSAGVVIASTDKDLLQLTTVDGVTVHDPYGIKGRVTADLIHKRFGVGADQLGDLLALAGDASDGVPGVDGIGEGTAAKLLNAHKTLDGVLAFAAQMATTKTTQTIATLHQQRERALLSRRLVELLNCPLPSRWWTWPADRPRPHWGERLERSKLFKSANRLSQLLGEPSEHPPLGGLMELITESSPPSQGGAGGGEARTPTAAASELTTGSMAVTSDAGIPEDVLRLHYGRGVDWRAESPGIVARMKARTPEEYCREFWEHEAPELLAFARGALGLPFEDQRSKPAGVEQPMKFARATARALFE